jgi:hypothetical protein
MSNGQKLGASVDNHFMEFSAVFLAKKFGHYEKFLNLLSNGGIFIVFTISNKQTWRCYSNVTIAAILYLLLVKVTKQLLHFSMPL